MKYIARLLTGMTLLALVACSEDFLDLAPISNANVESFYVKEADFDLAVKGAYTSLHSDGVFHDYVPLIGDLYSDNTIVGTTAGSRVPFHELSEFRIQPTSEIVSKVWNHHYQGIARCNVVVDKIETISFSSEEKRNALTAEARFLRGLYYFNLVRIFGDVPLILFEIKSVDAAYSIGRAPSADVYKAIEDDLLFAAKHLPVSYTGVDIGRATNGAAKGLLGKVYLTQKKYPEAATILKEVITSKQYALLPSFSDLWKPANKNSREALFEVQFKRQAGVSTGSYYSVRFTPYLSSAALIGVATTEGGYNTPTEDLVNAYSATDKRKAISAAESYTDQKGNVITGLSGRHTKKFLSSFAAGQGSDDNWPVLRYADVLLMYAEALNEVSFQADGEAFTYLNEVRQRAGLSPVSTTAVEEELRVADDQAFRLTVEKERRLELALEGHRWFDLVRTGRAVEALKSKNIDVQPHQMLLPIPQEQIDINPKVIFQNQDY